MALRGITAILVSCMLVSGANATSLRDAVREAVETNPRIEEAQAGYRASGFVLQQAQGRLFPEIDLSADAGRQRINRPNGLGPDVNDEWRNRKQATINIRQILFDGFDRANDIYRSQATITAASGQVLARAEAVGLAAVEAYIDVTRHQRLLGLSRENVRRHQTLLRLIRERIDGGRAPVSDKQQTEERLAAAKALVAQIEVALGTAVAKYKNIVGRKPHKLKHVKYAKGLPRSSAQIVDYAYQNNPELLALEANAEAAEFEKEQFKSSFYPQVYLEGSATRGHNLEGTPGRNDEYRATVTLTWRLFDGGVRMNREMELAERASQRRLEQQIRARDLQEEIETSWARFTVGKKEVSALLTRVEQNRQIVVAYKNEYELDKRSLLDVLDAESSRFASEFEYFNSLALNVFSSYQLLAGMGALLDKLGIETPEGGEVIPDSSTSSLGAIRFDSKSFVIPPLR